MYVPIFTFCFKLFEQVHPNLHVPEESYLHTKRSENHKYPKYWQDYWIRTDFATAEDGEFLADTHSRPVFGIGGRPTSARC
jgi:hypothetical protein